MSPLRTSLSWLCFACASVSALFGQVPYEAGDWPQWRGPEANGISRETGLLKEWPEEGPKILWQVESVGVGYSSIAVKGGRIYTLGDLSGVEHVNCLDSSSGSTLWEKQPGPLAELLDLRVEVEFKQLDRNSDGRIDEAEALARFGWDFTKYDLSIPGANAEELARKRSGSLLRQIDANSDGQLDYSEGASLFRDAFDRMDTEDKEADANALATSRTTTYLKRLDADNDGKLSRQEVRQTALERHFGRIDQRDANTNKGDELLTAEEIKQSLLKHEPGRDGLVTAKELLEYYIRSNVSGDGELSAGELRLAFGGYRNGMGDGPRGTPTVDGERLYVEGGNGDVACMVAATGETVWHISLSQDFGGRTPGWGYSESPLIVDQLVIVTPGGQQGTIVALDKMTGSKVWQSSNVAEGAHYSTPVLATIGGVKQLVQFGNQSVFGVALNNGQLLWSYKAPANGTANCCSPIVDGDYVFASSAYGTGGGLVKVTGSGDTQQAEQVYFESKLQCHHGGIVKIGNYMYTCGGGPLTCTNFLTGEIAWQARSAGKGSLVGADGMLYILAAR